MRRLAALLLLVTLSAALPGADHGASPDADAYAVRDPITLAAAPTTPTPRDPDPVTGSERLGRRRFGAGRGCARRLGDSRPSALAAVRAAVALLGLPIAEVYIQPGIFWCGVLWPRFQSMPPCAGISVVPGASMHGWVAFAGTARLPRWGSPGRCRTARPRRPVEGEHRRLHRAARWVGMWGRRRRGGPGRQLGEGGRPPPRPLALHREVWRRVDQRCGRCPTIAARRSLRPLTCTATPRTSQRAEGRPGDLLLPGEVEVQGALLNPWLPARREARRGGDVACPSP